MNTNMEYTKEEFLEKFLDEIDFFAKQLQEEKISKDEFIEEIINHANWYYYEIH